jgi:protein phosphatase methylesterase 1
MGHSKEAFLIVRPIASPHQIQTIPITPDMPDLGFASWDKYWDHKATIDVPSRGTFNYYSIDASSQYVIIAIHGAGHSALSFSLLGNILKGALRFYAIDLKCHGDTPGDPTKDLGIDSLTADVAGFCQAIRPPNTYLVLLGHSLGGCIAARVALEVKCSAVIVVDTIEVSSIQSLPQMKQLLLTRPKVFGSSQEAIRYISMCGEMHNMESAAVSAGGRFKPIEDGRLTWKVDFMACEHEWKGWFLGFAETFLKGNNYRIVVLPDINRLDTPFTIAHMTGKFQLEIVLGTNHCVHEDKPKHIAAMLAKLVDRLSASHQWD